MPDCPICRPGLDRVVFANSSLLALRRASETGDGGMLLCARRHVACWRDLTPAERNSIAEAIVTCQQVMENTSPATPCGVSFNERTDHFHILIAPKAMAAIETPDPKLPGGSAAADTAVRYPLASVPPHDRALISGAEDALLRHLVPHIDAACEIDAAVSFAMTSGVRLLTEHLQDMLDRGGQLRLTVGDYLNVTEPDALRRLADLDGNRDLFVFRSDGTAYHPKAWIFRFEDGTGALIAGSSNLSDSALRSGIEWNLRLFGDGKAPSLIQARAEFDALLARPETALLTDNWIDAYEQRRSAPDRPRPEAMGVPDEPAPPAPTPHEIQAEALAALAASRAQGDRASLVVLATGLGKTFLAAFDTRDFRRVLFVAHREEILTQAMAAFRAVRPKARLGRFVAGEKDRNADILFASVQTLSRNAHLDSFEASAFDYIVVDEFHHAAAPTYRRIIDHFEPEYLLGLTATPERTDGGDLLSLCQENLVYRCDFWEGISRGLLSPFRYFGVPDGIEYAQIPWRSGHFDEEALTTAVATIARAENALDQLRNRGGKRTIGFCVSRRHADFMTRFFNMRGLHAVAVHSGASSAPRTSSLRALAAGELDVVFAIDMFNEGVDVPEIDTVLMLRPTESPIVWLQQFGRGLRRAEGKNHLAVVDYIGNHRIFLTKARALLQAGEGERALAERLREVRVGSITFPPGCEVTYELEALDILQSLIRVPRSGDGDELEAFYLDFRERHGTRPTALEVVHAGFDPRRTGYGGWFGFVEHQGDLADSRRDAFQTHGAFLKELERTPMTRSYEMLVLRAMLDEGALPGRVEISRLVERFRRIPARIARYRNGISADLDDPFATRAFLAKYPLPAWAEAGGGRWFTWDGQSFETTFARQETVAGALAELTSEIVDWRLGADLMKVEDRVFPLPDGSEPAEAAEPPGPSFGPDLWHEYMRGEIPSLFGAVFNSGSWNAGIVTTGREMILLVTLKKGSLASGNEYVDRFEDPVTFHWQSQNRTRRNSSHGRIISGAEVGWRVHLFVRGSKLRNGKAAPFRYCGALTFIEWEGDQPISVRWHLQAPVPLQFRRLFEIG